MKKVGLITEARMARPEEPKHYPLLSDDLFDGRVKLSENVGRGYAKMGIKPNTPAAKKEAARRKKLKEDDMEDLPMNKTPEASKMTTNAPRRTTGASTQVYNSMTDGQIPKNKGTFTSLKGTKKNNTFSHFAKRSPKIKPPTHEKMRQEAKDDNWIQGAEADIKRRGTEGKCTPITKPGCTGRAKALAKTFKKMAKKRDDSIKAKNEAKDANWIQGAEADIKRRGTEGKCTPITKPGCTGRAKALAKTFKKMAKKRDDSIVSKDERKKKVDEFRVPQKGGQPTKTVGRSAYGKRPLKQPDWAEKERKERIRKHDASQSPATGKVSVSQEDNGHKASERLSRIQKDTSAAKESSARVAKALGHVKKEQSTWTPEDSKKLGKFNPDVDENPFDRAKELRKRHVAKHGNTPVTAQGNKRLQRRRGEG